MMQEKSQLIIEQIPDDILMTATTLAKERVKHEYNRFGYSYEERIEKIKAGIIGELMFSRFLSKHDVPALYYMVIGKYDEGYDFRAGKFKIDVKATTFQKNSKSLDECVGILYNKFNLYIADDSGQARKAAADIYMQSFIISFEWCVLAGYSQGVPEATSNNPRNIYQAKKQPIPELEPMERLLSLAEIHPLCSKCGKPLAQRKRQIYRRGVGNIIVVDSMPEVMADSYKQHDKLYCADCF